MESNAPLETTSLHQAALRHHAQGSLAEAVVCLEQVLANDPEHVDALNDLGSILWTQGNMSRAETCFRGVVNLKPEFSAAYNNLACVLKAQGKVAEAIEIYEHALKLDPNFSDVHNNLGCAYKALGRWDEAVASLQRALELKPDFADAQSNLGSVLQDMDQLDDAVECHRRALALNPRHYKLHFNLALALQAKENYDEAIAAYRRSIELEPGFADAHNNLGCALKLQNQFDEAVSVFYRAIEIKPDNPSAYNNLGCTLQELGRFDEAMTQHRRAIELDPQCYEAVYNLGSAFHRQGQLPAALPYYERALEMRPDYAEAHLNLAALRLATGDFSGGWSEYEWRFKLKECPPRPFTQPLWDGSPLDGRRLLIHTEQGLGDTLHFVRYVKLLQQQGGHVIFGIQKVLAPLFEQSGLRPVIARGPAMPEFDVHIPLLSLPRLLNTTLETIPEQVPYLAANPQLVRQWSERLELLTGLRVGIHWQGNLKYQGDRFRSIPLAAFAPLAEIPGIHLISLQKNDGQEQLAEWKQRLGIVDLGPQLDTTTGAFMDTAAIIKNLDLVITSDTALAHLAGALCVPVWLAVSYASEWRWMLDRADNPWYPTMWLFRQPKLGDWVSVFKEIENELSHRVTAWRERTAWQRMPVEHRIHKAWELQGQGKLDEAVARYVEVLEFCPHYAEARFRLGVLQRRRREFAAARDSLRQVIEKKPRHAEAWCELAYTWTSENQPEQSLPCFQEAIRLKPDFAKAHNGLGCAFVNLQKATEAAECFQRAIELQPNYADALNNLGCLARSQGNPAKASDYLKQALEIKPRFADALNNLGNAYQDLDRYAEALVLHEEALRLEPNHAEAHNSLGATLGRLGQRERAVAEFDEAIRLNPRHCEAHLSRGMQLLIQGDLAGGWPEYEWRLRNKRFKLSSLPQPLWRGGDLKGQTLLVRAEQGAGDTFQFIRYLPLLQQQATGRVLCQVQRELLPLLTQSGFQDLIAQGESLPPIDVQVPLLSLPGIFKTTLDSIPAPGIYLHADPRLVEKWQERLSSFDGLKIGICWQGNPKYRDDHFRSIPLEAFRPLAEIEGAHLVSLQKHNGLDQLASLSDDWPIIDLSQELDEAAGPFMDTAAVLRCLDFVVTSDTAIAHLAGAMGVPTYVVLGSNPEWRWMLDREDSPWYSTLILVRSMNSDWRQAMQKIAKKLAMQVADRVAERFQ